MDLKQFRIIKFLRIKGLKLGEIAKKLLSACGLDASTM
jgi:DNA-binding transcriptional MerR regulator